MNESNMPPNSDLCTELLRVIGDFWTLAIIRALNGKELRFCEIERVLTGSNPVTLTSRLKKLEEAGFVNRIKESKSKHSVTYSLTEKGQGMLPILASIEKFADTFR